MAEPTTTTANTTAPPPTTTTTTTSNPSDPQPTDSNTGPHKILLLNGPNLNLLGTREPAIYGPSTLDSILSSLTTRAPHLNLSLVHFQSNHEGALIDRIQAARTESVSGIIVNPGGLTHTSVALRDALLGVGIPFVELHVSNVHAREQWRHHSYLQDKAVGIICGLGAYGYVAALEFWSWRLGGGVMRGI